jgi:hypothetical protein
VYFSINSLRVAGIIVIIFYLVCEVIGTAATPGLLCQPRVIVKMIVEKQMECKLVNFATRCPVRRMIAE